jgi:hypothetical protein
MSGFPPSFATASAEAQPGKDLGFVALSFWPNPSIKMGGMDRCGNFFPHFNISFFNDISPFFNYIFSMTDPH